MTKSPLRAALAAYMRAANAARGLSPKKVAFSSFKGAAFSDSPRAIAKALHRLRPDADIVFQLRGGADAPDWVRRVPPHSPKWLYELSTARVVVDNFNRPFFQPKFKGQKYVQTWHGDRGFKRVLYDKDPDGGFPDGERIDLAVAGSDFGESMYRTAFRYRGEVLKVGLPRNDALLNAADTFAARKKTDLLLDKKILLYAPTFRDSMRGGAYTPNLDIARAVSKLHEITGEDWLCVARAHGENTRVAGAMIDRSQYPEMSDLLMAADLLITDYSSCAGDFPLLGRPVILWHAAQNFERDLYFDIETSPFFVARTEDELYAHFEHLERAPENARAILDFFGTCETGRSAEAVAARISEWLDDSYFPFV
ncbi:MAG: CDP-glycerol glycerophosphotransferase family protein [Christensenellales bacterium]|jgi:CDP-glycerol glycerophosphotransferase